MTDEGRWERRPILDPGADSPPIDADCWVPHEATAAAGQRRSCAATFNDDDLYVSLIAVGGEDDERVGVWLADELVPVLERLIELDPSI